MKKTSKLLPLLTAAFATFATLVLFSASAEAIPAFARRYETSCTTCHLVYPKLTPFGEAFRRNGFRFPQNGDETSQKREPVALGNEAQKDVWPDTVYPGEIPQEFPVSLVAEFRMVLGKSFEGHGSTVGGGDADAAGGHAHGAAGGDEHEKTQLKFDEVGSSARLLAGGTLGKIATFFGAFTLGGHEEPLEVERLSLSFFPVEPQHLQIKVGRFEPELHGVSIHRNVMGHQLRLTTTRLLANGFAPEPFSQGVQASGVVVGRLGWAGGVVQNAAPVEGIEKDVYGRVEGKLGGMRLDGINAEAASKAWRERSITFGASGYGGRSLVTDAASGLSHNDRFIRAGADVHVVLDDLLVDLVGVRQWHRAPAPDADEGRRVMNLAYAEVTYVTLPWLFPTARYEGSLVTDGPRDKVGWVALAGLNCLVRANVILRADVAYGKDEGKKPDFRSVGLAAGAAM